MNLKPLSDPKSLNPPGTFNLRKPRLARIGLPKTASRFTQPAGVPHMGKIVTPKVKMIPMSALAPHVVIPKIQRFGK